MEQIFLCLTHQGMLRQLTTLTFRWASNCIRGSASCSTAFLPLSAVMSTDSSNERKMDLQLGYGQNSIEYAVDELQISMPIFSSPRIHRLPMEAKYKPDDSSATRAGPDLIHYSTTNSVRARRKTTKVISKDFSEQFRWTFCIGLHCLCGHPLLPIVGNG